MSLTVLLASCALRLAQLSAKEEENFLHQESTIKTRLHWSGMAIAATLALFWAGSVTIGPARASSYWDSYLFTSLSQRNEHVEHMQALQQSSTDRIIENSEYHSLRAAIYNLQRVVTYDQDSPRAHLRLAGKYLQLFDILQSKSENPMSIDQIRDAAIASKFSSEKQLNLWLQKAVGEHSKLLYRAYYHAHKSLRLCPLQGRGYLHLADLCFLTGQDQRTIIDYVNQSERVRPLDSRIIFEAGRQHILIGQNSIGIEYWQRIFLTPGSHQLTIVMILAEHTPASAFTKLFNPDWRTLSYLWSWYQSNGSAEDLQHLVHYAENHCETQCPHLDPPQAATFWLHLARMQQKLSENDKACSSLARAFKLTPNSYKVRREYGQLLLNSNNFQLAEPHLRWCYARQPDDAQLQKALAHAARSSKLQAARAESKYH